MQNERLIAFKDGQAQFSFEIVISDNRKIDKKTGFLYCTAIFGHTGVQEYYAKELGMGDYEIVKVHRFAEDVFSDEAMASIEGKSVTKMHPTELVTKKNYKNYDVGTILKVWRDGDNIVGNIVIKDADTIMDILDGKLESLSLGYEAKLVPLNDGEFKQTNLHINHLAVVKNGRAKNARILDEDTIGKEKPKMGKFMNFLFGKKIQLNDDDTITVIEDAKHVSVHKSETEETSTYDDETGEEKRETITKSESTHKVIKDDEGEKSKTDELMKEATATVKDEEKDQEKQNEETTSLNDDENKEKEKKEEIEDMDKDQIKFLFGDVLKEFKEELMKEIKPEQKKEESVFKDTKVIETQDGEKQTEKLTLNFEKDEKLRAVLYDKMTNPMAHGGDFKALNAFRKKALESNVR